MTNDNRTPLYFDVCTYLHIDQKLIAGEVELYQSKWWDYKPLHPLQATLEFAEAFKRAIKEAIKRRKCLYRGHNYKGLKEADLLDNRPAVITGMWKARRMADKYGIPYDFYCSHAMQYCAKRDYRFLPGPSQIYSQKPKNKDDISMVDWIVESWVQVNKNRIFYPLSDVYNVVKSPSNRYQIEYQRFLIAMIKRRTAMRFALVGEIVYEKQLLHESAIRLGIENGEYLLKQARDFAD